MYMKRINNWNLHKNYKKAEKDAMVVAVKTRKTSLAALKLKDRPVKRHLLIRHCRETGQSLDHNPQPQANPSATKPLSRIDDGENGHLYSSVFFDEMFPARQLTEYHAARYTELALLQVRNFCDTFMDWKDFRWQPLEYATETHRSLCKELFAKHGDLYRDVHKTRGMLPSSQLNTMHASSWALLAKALIDSIQSYYCKWASSLDVLHENIQMMNDVLELVRPLLSCFTPGSLEELFFLIGCTQQPPHDFGIMVRRHICDMAQVLHGICHPLTVLVNIVDLSEETVDDIARNIVSKRFEFLYFSD